MESAIDCPEPSPFVAFRVPIAIGCAAAFLSLAAIVCLFSLVRVREPIRFSGDFGSSASESAVSTRFVVVDVAGAVHKPGVYRIPEGSRIADAITVAGEVTEKADADYLERVMNRAAIVKDGAKLYIPVYGNSGNSGNSIPGQNSPVILSTASSRININTSTASELDTLPGVGVATAEKIIRNRPYQTLEELVSKKSVSRTVFDGIKDRLVL